MLKTVFAVVLSTTFALFAGSVAQADWSYQFLTLQELIEKSDLIVVAELQSVVAEHKNGQVMQNSKFIPSQILKGQPRDEVIPYHASYIPDLCAPPVSHYLEAAPRTKFLLFLTKQDDTYVSTVGPCGALEIVNPAQVLWYTDTSQAQHFYHQWKATLLEEVIATIKEGVKQDAPVDVAEKIPPHQKLLSDHHGEPVLPDTLVSMYAKFVEAASVPSEANLRPFVLPHGVTFTTATREEKLREYGTDINLPFLKSGFQKQILSSRQESDQCYLVRTASSYIRYVKTSSGDWMIYGFGDKPIE